MRKPTAAVDAADEAGGETVFSSDGMDPLPIPKAPVISENSWLEGEALLETTTPHTPFHFQGESPRAKLVRLQKEVSELKKELPDNDEVAKLSQDLSARLFQVTSVDDLVRTIQQHQQDQQETGDRASPKEGLVYELYGGSSAPSSSVEERLLAMERLVGGTSTKNESLMKRLGTIEKLVDRMDEKSLDEASTRAKIIR